MITSRNVEDVMSEELAKPRNVFTNKNFRLVFFGALVSNIASLFYSFAVSFYVLKLTGNNALIQGLYLAMSGVIFGLTSLFGGVISDRFNKAKIMYTCDYLKGGIIIIFTILLMTIIKSNNAKVIALFVVALFSNVIAGIFTPASNALLPQIVSEESFQQAQAYFSMLNSMQSIVGIILAGLLYSFVPINLLFLIVGICYIISAISEMFIKYHSKFEKNDEKLTSKIVFQDLKEGFKYIYNAKSLLSLMLCVLFINFFVSPIFENFTSYFIATDLTNSAYLFKDHLKPEMWSSIFSVFFGIGSLAMGIGMAAMKPRDKYNKVIRFALTIFSACLVVMTLVYIFYRASFIKMATLQIICLFIYLTIGISLVLCNVPISTAMLKVVDKDKFGKVSSVLSIGSEGLTPVSLFLAGLAISIFGSSGLLIICTSGLVITTLFTVLNKPIKEL